MNQLHLTPVVRNLIIINALLFLGKFLVAAIPWEALSLYYPTSEYFRPFQFITSLFMHANIMHIIMNMFGLAVFGPLLEMVWGARRFLVYYLLCGIGANIIFTLWAWFQWAYMGHEEPIFALLGASGALYGVLLGVGVLYPRMELRMLFFPMPIQARYMVFIWAGIELLGGFGQANGDNVAHFAHLGGMLVGFVVLQYWRFFGSNL